MSIQDTLDERQKQHGPFDTHCKIERELRFLQTMHGGGLTNVQYIGLGMILHKIARILNDGNMHADTWHDIAGYATLIEQDMTKSDFKDGTSLG